MASVQDEIIKPAQGTVATRILVVRPDRIGDVILSTPAFEVLKRHYPRAHLTVMVREAVVPLLKGLPSVDDVLIFDPDGRHRGIGGFFQLISDIREKKFYIAVVLQSHWKIAAALFGAGVRYRVGPLSKLHSFLFFNRGRRQRRSQVEMHEVDYNLQLLRRLGIRVGTRNVMPQVTSTEEMKEWGKNWLLEKGWKENEHLVVVHPGMGGSALNWPENHYVELIRALLKEGRKVLVTCGPSEGAVLGRIQEELGQWKDKAYYYGGHGIGPVDRLTGLFNWATLVIAPSTGPLHLAVALGKHVLCFYPPIAVQSAIRWGPYSADDTKSVILVPEVYCGEEFRCRGTLCNYFPCMKSLTVTQALEEAQRQLARAEGEPSSASKV